MQEKVFKFIKKNQSIYWAYFLLLADRMLAYVTIFSSSFMSMVRILGLGILAITLLHKIFSADMKSRIFILFFSSLFFIVYITAKSPSLLVIFFLMVGMPDVEFSEFIEKDMFCRLILFIFVVIMYYLGMTNNFFSYRSGEFIRSSMGFANPNTAGLFLMTLFADYCYLRFNHMNLKNYLFIILGIIMIKYICDSRTNEIALILLLVLNILLTKVPFKEFFKNTLKYIIFFIPVGILAMSLFLGYQYNGQGIYQKLNHSLSSRLSFSHYYLTHYDYTLFGQKIVRVNSREAKEKDIERYILDNSYLSLVINFGILPTIGFMFLIFTTFFTAYRENNLAIISLIIVFFIIGFFENYLYLFQSNVYILYFSNVFFKKKGGVVDEKI